MISTAAPVDLEKMKSKISMLLAKAESTTFPAERETYNDAAHKMMLRLGISAAELEASGQTRAEKIVQVERDFTGNYAISMIDFTNSVLRGFGHLTMLQKTVTHNGMKRRAYIIGHESDVEQFCRLLDSLTLQVMSSLRAWQKETVERRRHLTDMEKYVQHRSFIEGFGTMVGTRLRNQRQTEEKTASPGAALVLASKKSLAESWVRETYPDVRKGSATRNYSQEGSGAGARAGARARLGESSIDSKMVLN